MTTFNIIPETKDPGGWIGGEGGVFVRPAQRTVDENDTPTFEFDVYPGGKVAKIKTWPVVGGEEPVLSDPIIVCVIYMIWDNPPTLRGPLTIDEVDAGGSPIRNVVTLRDKVWSFCPQGEVDSVINNVSGSLPYTGEENPGCGRLPKGRYRMRIYWYSYSAPNHSSLNVIEEKFFEVGNAIPNPRAETDTSGWPYSAPTLRRVTGEPGVDLPYKTYSAFAIDQVVGSSYQATFSTDLLPLPFGVIAGDADFGWLEWQVQLSPGTGGPSCAWDIDFDWYDSADEWLSTSDLHNIAVADNGWTWHSGIEAVPADAVRFDLWIRATATGTATAYITLVHVQAAGPDQTVFDYDEMGYRIPSFFKREALIAEW